MGDAGERLRERIHAELARPLPDEALRLAEAIRARHGGAVASVVFYGSCLRSDAPGGVHDYYAVVDGYRAAYASRALAAANALLPPNVFPIAEGEEPTPLRAKYAVVSRADLLRGCAGRARRPGLWARFAQPVAAAWVRDAGERDVLAGACVDAVCTAVRTGLALGGPGWQRVEPDALWRALFRATYAAELRPERSGVSDVLYEQASARFDAVLEDALALLAERGALERDAQAPARVRVRGPLARLPRPGAAKAMAALQLVKSAVTFRDWLPYALWKLERHSGVRLEATPRQRRHPWLLAWPLLLRALRRGALR